MHKPRSILGLTVLLALAPTARADVRLPALFTDNMVLQRDVAAPIWGWADDGEQITIEINGKTVHTTAKDGKFKTKLPRLKASSNPTTLKIAGKNNITINNVLVGEVWIASGQSNMEFPLKASYQSADDIKNSTNPNIRLFTVPKNKQLQPVDDVKASWVECKPDTVPNFSAVGYYFGRDLQKALGVPVGLIHTSWGGSPAEVWMSDAVLSGNPDYKRDILDTYATQEADYKKAQANWEKEKAEAQAAGKEFTKKGPIGPFWRPTELYNGMIAPLIPYAIKGAIWYQGESNAGRHKQYRTLFPDMIKNWRKDWGEGDFTFLAVQLAPWDMNRKRSLEEIAKEPAESDWAALREAQVYTEKVVPKYGLAVITDVGDKDDIHPTKKEPVGARLALLAEKIAYGKHIVAEGPTFKSMKITKINRDRYSSNAAVLTFDNVDGGLESKDGDLKGFAIAGEDKKFVWATAKIEGNKIVVSNPSVEHPTAVRYGWADFPIVNLQNKEGLPASPFRTDAPKD
jgi:sialate O-acetylesterase